MEEREEKVKNPTHRHTLSVPLALSTVSTWGWYLVGTRSQGRIGRQTQTHARERREMQSARVLAGLGRAGTGGPAEWIGGLLAVAQRQSAARRA